MVQRLTGPLPPPPTHPPLPTSHPSSKVPIITNYNPQLPMGPGSMPPFPFNYPQLATPSIAATTSATPVISSHDNSHQRKPESVEAAATLREAKRVPSREEQLHNAMRQKQQLLQNLEMAQVVQAHAHAQLPTPHLMQGTVCITISHELEQLATCTCTCVYRLAR